MAGKLSPQRRKQLIGFELGVMKIRDNRQLESDSESSTFNRCTKYHTSD